MLGYTRFGRALYAIGGISMNGGKGTTFGALVVSRIVSGQAQTT